jgi:hypothetical protein
MIVDVSICSTLASEVRAITTQRFNEMNQLPTDTPSHVKALNKLEREAGDKGTVTQPNLMVRSSKDTELMCQATVNTIDETATIAYALLLSEPQTPLNYHFWRIKYHW